MSTTTVATGTPVADDTDELTFPGPWQASFDLGDDEHCFGSMPDRISDLPTTVRARLGDAIPADPSTLTYYDLRDALERAIHQTQDAIDELDDDQQTGDPQTLLEALEDALDDIRPHGGCQCGLDTWQSWGEDWHNTLICGSVEPGTVWAVFDSGDESRTEFTSADPTIAEIWHSLNTRDGWSELELSWDPTTRRLDFMFGSDPGQWNGYAIALTPEQQRLGSELAELASYQDCPHAFAATCDPHILETVVNLWENDGDQERVTCLSVRYDDDPQQAVLDLTAQLAGTDDEHRKALAALSATWTSTVEDLIATVAAIAAA